MQRVISLRCCGSPGEPSTIQFVAGRLGSAGEVPAVVPDLDPGVIPALVRPQRRAHKPRRHSDRPTGVDQNHAQPGAGSQPRLDRFLRALIGLASLGRVTHLELGKDLLIQDRRRLAGRLDVFDQRAEFFAELFAPFIPSLVDVGIRQNVIEKHFLRHGLLPGRFVPGGVTQPHIIQQKLRRQAPQVSLGHVDHQKPHSLGLIFRHPIERRLNLGPVVAGLGQRRRDSAHL